MLRAYGTDEVIYGLPMLLTLEDYWNVPEEHSTRNTVAFNIEIHKHLRLFFISFLASVSDLFECSALNKLFEDLKYSWEKLDHLPHTLTLIPSETISVNTNNIMVLSVSSDYKNPGGKNSGVRLSYDPAAVKNDILIKNIDVENIDDMDEDNDDVCTINRQELLTALLLGSGFRSLSLQIRQVCTYVRFSYDSCSKI